MKMKKLKMKNMKIKELKMIDLKIKELKMKDLKIKELKMKDLRNNKNKNKKYSNKTEINLNLNYNKTKINQGSLPQLAPLNNRPHNHHSQLFTSINLKTPNLILLQSVLYLQIIKSIPRQPIDKENTVHKIWIKNQQNPRKKITM